MFLLTWSSNAKERKQCGSFSLDNPAATTIFSIHLKVIFVGETEPLHKDHSHDITVNFTTRSGQLAQVAIMHACSNLRLSRAKLL